MGILLIPLALGLLGWLAYLSYRSLVRRDATKLWFAAFFVLLTMGVALGVYFGFYFNYLASPTLRVYAFPVPAAVLVLETYDDGTQSWVEFITPAPILFAGSNIPLFACASVLPVWCLHTLLRFTRA